MVTGKALDLFLQHYLPRFIPMDVSHGVSASVPDFTRVRIDVLGDYGRRGRVFRVISARDVIW